MNDLFSALILSGITGLGSGFFLMLFHKVGLMRFLSFNEHILIVKYLFPSCDFCMSFRICLVLLVVLAFRFNFDIEIFIISLICSTAMSTAITK